MPAEPYEEEPTAAYVASDTFVPLTPAELTARLPNLEVTEILGQGGKGVVYKGRQLLLDRPVAIKLIRREYV